MKILITGAYGNLGLMCVEQALALGYKIKCFDLKTAANQKLADEYAGQVETVLGDLRDADLLKTLVDDVDAIIHNASLLPPLTETQSELAQAVNVDACKVLIDLAEASPLKPVFIFPSSVTVFGLPQGKYKVKTAYDSVEATDNYTRHKLEIESYLLASELPWVVLRVGVSVDARTLATDRATFKKLLSIKADNPLEYVHPKDVALAMCKAASTPAAVGKVLLLGGGASCQVTQREFLSTAFNQLGLNFPPSLHGKEAFYTHWMDTAESQKILQYQQHDFSAYQQELGDKLRYIRLFLWPLRWLSNPLLLLILRQIKK
ncbi:MAG: NAD(P)-dependent oxidoreductase [Pseudomonadales bacterium]|nr:NAD(P)-dependent oxidoreductase [Pseudomonadales bacterium]